MVPVHRRPIDDGNELWIGLSSWDVKKVSGKYAWKDRLGRWCRGGEIPVYAIPQMLTMAIEAGHLRPEEVLTEDAKIISKFFAALLKSRAS